MPFYYQIDPTDPNDRRTAERLMRLRTKLQQPTEEGGYGVPARTMNETLLLATWNIREFDSSKGGDRLKESIYYIAEIVSHFDLVAVQEVRENLHALRWLVRVLGDWWDYVVTDVTEGTQGNRERLAYLFDTRKVRFGGVAGEVVIPPVRDKSKKTFVPADQLARTPYLAGFQVGWFKFMLCTVHIVYGKSVPDDPRRVREIQELAQFLKKRATEGSAWANNFIALGDFNIFAPGDPTFSALTDVGFVIPKEIQRLPNNVARNKHYDQIGFLLSRKDSNFTGRAGIINFYDTVFTNEDEATYVEAMGDRYHTTAKGKKKDKKGKRRYYRTNWRTFQMSDHLPMWVELNIDFAQDYLKRKLRGS